MKAARYDAVVVGAGPNGLAAAVVLARAGLSTILFEAAAAPGGGTRTRELTLPGFRHDVCSSVHPLGLASPLFRELALERDGLAWVEPSSQLVHLANDGTPVSLERSIDATAAQLGRDAEAYRHLMGPIVESFDDLIPMILGPLRFPERPILLARFGFRALRSMRGLGRERFAGEAPPALLSGISAHAMVPLDAAASSSFALVLAAAAHAVGWPVARGGSQAIADALTRRFLEAGGELVLGHLVRRIDELPPAHAYVLDVTPRQLLAMAGEVLPRHYRRGLERFRYGPGVFKMDWALSAPIPWRDPAVARAATVHLAGSLDDVADSERAVHAGQLARAPFVILVQPTLFDPSRAPAGKHTAWAYCHVPHGSAVDASSAIEAQIERFAPGFRDAILGRSAMNAHDVERYDPNYVGGDINGGLSDLGQLFFRPMMRADPYATPVPGLFLCSSSTPPGGGVHGMCGYWAAHSVLEKVFGRSLRKSA